MTNLEREKYQINHKKTHLISKYLSNYSDVFTTQSNIYDGAFCVKG